MKIFSLLSLLLIPLSTNLLNAESNMTKLEGGLHNFDLRFYSSMLTGIGAKSSNFGNTISSLISTPALVSTNPAGMSFMNKSAAVFDFSPGFSLDLNKLADLQTEFDTSLNDQNMKPGVKPKYGTMDVEGGQLGGLDGMAAVLQIDRVGSFGAAVHRNLLIDLDMVSNKISTSILDENNDAWTKVEMNIDLFGNLKLSFNQVDFSYSRKIYDNLSVGYGISYLFGSIEGNLDSKMTGLMLRDQDPVPKIFNDPNDPWRNTLNSTIDIDFKKNYFLSNKLGVTYQQYDWLFYDATISTPREQSFSGNLDIVQHTLGALNINADEDAGEEMFDLSKVDAAQITHTNEISYHSNTLVLNYPGGVGFSVGMQKGIYRGIFAYEIPIGELSMNYKCTVQEKLWQNTSTTSVASYSEVIKNSTKNYTVGFNPKHSFKFAFGVGDFAGYEQADGKGWYASIGGQAMIVDQILDNVLDDEGKQTEETTNMLLGSLVMGCGMNLTTNFSIDVNVVALPGPIGRTSITYNF